MKIRHQLKQDFDPVLFVFHTKVAPFKNEFNGLRESKAKGVSTVFIVNDSNNNY